MLDLHAFTRRYGALTAADSVDLHVTAGNRHAIIGPNGAGKSTILGAIAGTITPTHGQVLLHGRDITSVPAHRRARHGIGRTFQHPSLLTRHTATENVTIALHHAHGLGWSPLPRPRRSRILAADATDLLDRVGLTPDGHRLAGELSHGQQRHLELAVALAARPSLLLLDEPTAGLAQPDTDTLVDLLTRLTDITLLFIEHHLDVAFGLADTVTVIHLGQVITTGTPRHVRAHPRVRDVYLHAAGLPPGPPEKT